MEYYGEAYASPGFLSMNTQVAIYLQPFINKEKRLHDAVTEFGLEFGPDRTEEVERLRAELSSFTRDLNDGRSLHLNKISPACRYCNIGTGATTFILSLACNRDCYFCTNKNQENYGQQSRSVNDVITQFEHFSAAQNSVKSVALTGGEPLLFPKECVDFFRHVKSYDHGIHTRLYSNGDLVEEEMLRQLSPYLDEIRIGIKPDQDGHLQLQDTEELLVTLTKHIGQVTIEMPVLPGSFEKMRPFLDLCNRIQIFSLNLLEFLFPWHHADRYRAMGYKIKHRPYDVIYNYSYAGGLPVDGSESEVLRCLVYAKDQGFSVGVHYCSLENKLTSQIYQQNIKIPLSKTELRSHKDHFLKSARFFGLDAAKAKSILEKIKGTRFIWDDRREMLECHPVDLVHLKESGMDDVIITFAVAENDGYQTTIREVHYQNISLTDFSPEYL